MDTINVSYFLANANRNIIGIRMKFESNKYDSIAQSTKAKITVTRS